MVITKSTLFQTLRMSIFLCLLLGSTSLLHGQDKNDSSSELGVIAFPKKVNPIDQYVYDTELEMYVYVQSDGIYPLNIPLVLSPKEYERLVLKDQMNVYFKEKVGVISQKKGSIQQAAQKDLLPELYLNSKFFTSIFGGNEIDVTPQGSVGIDLGLRYQKTDNPAFSPRNRRNFGFDFDQRISLSLLGKIGERLQITANYDTESTFDFQNLVKLEFNPPKVNDLQDYLPSSISEKKDDLEGKANQVIDKASDFADRTLGFVDKVNDKVSALEDNISAVQNKASEYQNRINDFLNKPASEDAILQNIDIGNISMPLNSSLISGAQSLMGVKAEVKFGRTNITGVFAEQRSQAQSVIAQGGGTLQEFSLFALDYEADRHFFLAHYFRDNYNDFLKNYPYINSPIQITRVEVWVTNRQSQTNNIRNIIALQDLGEADPNNTRADELNSSFFNSPTPRGIPANQANKLNPDTNAGGSFITDAIRDVATVPDGFGA